MIYGVRVRQDKRPLPNDIPAYDPLKKDYTEGKWFDMKNGTYEAMVYSRRYENINQAYKNVPKDYSFSDGCSSAVYYVVVIEE